MADEEKKKKVQILIDPDINDLDKLSEAVLNMMQRRKRAMNMRKFKSKLKMGRKRMAKRMASPERLKMKARKKALVLMKKKLSGGKNYNDLSVAEKQIIDKRMQARKAAVDRIAKRLLPTVRKAELDKMRSKASPANESVIEVLTLIESVMEALDGATSEIITESLDSKFEKRFADK